MIGAAEAWQAITRRVETIETWLSEHGSELRFDEYGLNQKHTNAAELRVY